MSTKLVECLSSCRILGGIVSMVNLVCPDFTSKWYEKNSSQWIPPKKVT
jgi:hypothetical protein